MDWLVDLSWRAYPGSALMVLGGLAFARGAWAIARSWRGPIGERAVGSMVGFRIAVAGFAIVGVGAAWTWQLVWLLILALVIGGEELLESSWALYALRRSSRALDAYLAVRARA